MNNEETKTRYESKLEHRKDEEKEEKRKSRILIGIVAAFIILFIACLGINKYSEHKSRTATYITVGSHEIQKEEYDFYFYSAYSSFLKNYANVLSYMSLDTTKPLSAQQYTDELTWQEYFDMSAINQIVNTYGLYDASLADKSFKYDITDKITEMEQRIKDSAASSNASVKSYIKDVYGEYAVMDDIVSYARISYTARAYQAHIKDDIKVTDEQAQAYYTENKNDYDLIDYIY